MRSLLPEEGCAGLSSDSKMEAPQVLNAQQGSVVPVCGIHYPPVLIEVAAVAEIRGLLVLPMNDAFPLEHGALVFHLDLRQLYTGNAIVFTSYAATQFLTAFVLQVWPVHVFLVGEGIRR